MYLPRIIEQKIIRMAQRFKVVLVVGARQVGKSTLLTHCFPSFKHITFDAVTDEYAAKEDPIRFLNNFSAPIILDEIQYCPEILSPLKRYVDQSNQNGQYLLTGSQNLSMLTKVAESMAGRVGIIRLDGLCIDEITQVPQNLLQCYLETPHDLVKCFSGTTTLPYSLYQLLWRGSLPGIIGLEDMDLPDYFASYIKTYIERDIRLLENVQNIGEFERFVRLLAAFSAQEINYSMLGAELGIARATALRWLQLFKQGYQWEEISPYFNNLSKRVAKKPKGFISDTGMLCYLQRISSPLALPSHPLLGAIFETFITGNFLKIANTISTPPYPYHWRTAAGAEVDLIFERDGKLYPIEIKCKSKITKHDARGLRAFRESHATQKIMPGIIIYTGNVCYELDDHVFVVPWNAIFE